MAIVFPQNLHLGSEVDVALYTSKMVNNSDVCCDECVDGRYCLADVLKPREHDCSQPTHEDNDLIAYCETCSLLLRRDCTTATHKSHTVKEISTVAKNRQKEITGALDHAKEVVTKLTGAIDENNRMIEQVEISKQTASTKPLKYSKKHWKKGKRHYCQSWRPFHCPRQQL